MTAVDAAEFELERAEQELQLCRLLGNNGSHCNIRTVSP